MVDASLVKGNTKSRTLSKRCKRAERALEREARNVGRLEAENAALRARLDAAENALSTARKAKGRADDAVAALSALCAIYEGQIRGLTAQRDAARRLAWNK